MMRCYKLLTLTHMEIKKADDVIRYRVYCIIDSFFKDETVAVEAQMLKILLTSKKLK